MFLQDFAASQVDVTLFGLVGAAPFTLEFVPVKGTAVSATNPRYNGNAVLGKFTPVGGTVGDLLDTTAEFQGVGALSRSSS